MHFSILKGKMKERKLEEQKLQLKPPAEQQLIPTLLEGRFYTQ